MRKLIDQAERLDVKSQRALLDIARRLGGGAGRRKAR